MALIQGKFIADNAVDGSKVKLENNQSLKARNSADNADIDLIKADASDNIILQNDTFVGSDKVQTAADKGIANGIAPLDSSGLISSTYLPSFVDDVEEYANLASFPATGESGKIYIALDTNKTYRWSGSAYVEISSGAVDSVNGVTGVVVLDTDDVSEGAANFYYTEGRFSTSFSGKSTTDLNEGTNLYFTEARAKNAAVLNTTAGNETDQAASVNSMKSYVTNQINGAAQSYLTQVITLSTGDIANGNVTLSQTPIAVLDVTPVGGLKQNPISDYTVASNTLTFAGDLASLLVAGDELMVTFVY